MKNKFYVIEKKTCEECYGSGTTDREFYYEETYTITCKNCKGTGIEENQVELQEALDYLEQSMNWKWQRSE